MNITTNRTEMLYNIIHLPETIERLKIYDRSLNTEFVYVIQDDLSCLYYLDNKLQVLDETDKINVVEVIASFIDHIKHNSSLMTMFTSEHVCSLYVDDIENMSMA